MRQKLYLCAPCKHVETLDVPTRGPIPVRAHSACGRVMTPTFPSLVASLIRKHEQTTSDATGTA